MDWIKNLPLDSVSEHLAGLIVWWSNLVAGVPDEYLPLVVYVIASVLVLLLWIPIMRILPVGIRGISWAFLAALLFAPGGAAGEEGVVAPAIIGVFHSLLMKNFVEVVGSSLPILATFAAFLVIGAIWQLLRSVIEKGIAKNQEMAWIQQEKQRLAKSETLK
ncbi:hypothetical protein M2R47_06765 [Moraxella sp. Tifton1]|uniref:hypothetical protein n=1 Tax=Moraxella oculi TaxID=2940516 RepID=UPI0020122963|nr:hypothetical protein [Moraxella sp. Tifton1]MCL1623939.1 hypothetical protein [Moraxella sp. Tifton1]